MRRLLRLAPFGLSIALCASAFAQDADDNATKIQRTGPYLGVAPGVNDTAPSKVDVHGRGAVRIITWVGFQMIGQGGRVFVQATERPTYTLVPGAPNEVILEFTDTKLHTFNDSRLLDTAWFPTAVSSVKAEQFAGNVTRVVIKLREIVGYDLRQEGNYVILDFRPPSKETLEPPKPAAATAETPPAPE